MRLTDDRGWYGQPTRHERVWGTVAVLLGALGMAVLLLGQEWIYTAALWVGGLR